MDDESTQVTAPVPSTNKAIQPTAHVIGTKYTRTILSDLLPKQAHLRQRLSKRVTHHQAIRDFQKSVDRNNNNVGNGTDNVRDAAESICGKHGEKAASNEPPETSHGPSTLNPRDKEVSVGYKMNTDHSSELQYRCQQHISTLKSIPQSKNSTAPSPPTPFSPRRKHGIVDLRLVDGEKLINPCQIPYSRLHISKSAGLPSTRGRLSRDIYDPKEILLEKCGGIVTKSKTKLQSSSPSKATPSSVKQATLEMVSLHPMSPRSSSDSKSSRSATNHSDKSASTKSSHVALPSIAISPTMMRTN